MVGLMWETNPLKRALTDFPSGEEAMALIIWYRRDQYRATFVRLILEESDRGVDPENLPWVVPRIFRRNGYPTPGPRDP